MAIVTDSQNTDSQNIDRAETNAKNTKENASCGEVSQIGPLLEANSIHFSGQIVRISGDDFLLDDGTGQIWVDAESQPIRRANLAPGETVTVSGSLEDNELEAYRIIRENGEEIYVFD